MFISKDDVAKLEKDIFELQMSDIDKYRQINKLQSQVASLQRSRSNSMMDTVQSRAMRGSYSCLSEEVHKKVIKDYQVTVVDAVKQIMEHLGIELFREEAVQSKVSAVKKRLSI